MHPSLSTGAIAGRHVFHLPGCGQDMAAAWRAATGEPVFVWGRAAGAVTGLTFGPVRRAFAAWLRESAQAGLTVYHDGAGADALGPLDPAAHKVLFLHRWTPRWESCVEWFVRCTGKVLTGHAEGAAVLHQRFPWIPERFIGAVPEPPLAEAVVPPPARTGLPRTGIWLHGRDWRNHGNRLRSIADHWGPRLGELEMIVHGNGHPAWARRHGILWSRGLPLDAALGRLDQWDSVLVLDDFALDAPWLVRALARGCFPLVPAGDNPARPAAWSAPDAPAPYPWGDAGAALDRLRQWRAADAATRARFQDWCGPFAETDARLREFRSAWAAVKERFASQHPVRLRRRRPAPVWYPLGWYERILRLRQGL